jgi:hypothetical protein
MLLLRKTFIFTIQKPQGNVQNFFISSILKRDSRMGLNRAQPDLSKPVVVKVSGLQSLGEAAADLLRTLESTLTAGQDLKSCSFPVM